MQLIVHVPCPGQVREDPLFKTFEWAVIPRKGEQIILMEPRISLEIREVSHYLDIDMIEVVCYAPMATYEALRLSGWSREVIRSVWSQLKINSSAAKRRSPQTV